MGALRRAELVWLDTMYLCLSTLKQNLLDFAEKIDILMMKLDLL